MNKRLLCTVKKANKKTYEPLIKSFFAKNITASVQSIIKTMRNCCSNFILYILYCFYSNTFFCLSSNTFSLYSCYLKRSSTFLKQSSYLKIRGQTLKYGAIVCSSCKYEFAPAGYGTLNCATEANSCATVLNRSLTIMIIIMIYFTRIIKQDVITQ